MSSYPEQLEPGLYGATDPGHINAIVNALASGMSTGSLLGAGASMAPGALATLRGLGNAGEMALGGTPEAVAGANAISQGLSTPSGITVFIKGIQKGINGEQVPIYGVKGPAKMLLAMFGDAEPGSVPEAVLQSKGLLPKTVPESLNPTNPFAVDLRELWGNAALEQSGTPIMQRALYQRPDMFRQ